MNAILTMNSPRQNLIDALNVKRGMASGRALARALKVKPMTLHDAMSGRTGFSVGLLSAIRNTYPDLRPVTEAYIDSLNSEAAA